MIEVLSIVPSFIHPPSSILEHTMLIPVHSLLNSPLRLEMVVHGLADLGKCFPGANSNHSQENSPDYSNRPVIVDRVREGGLEQGDGEERITIHQTARHQSQDPPNPHRL